MATGGGLFRYDGVELRPWPRDSFRTPVRGLATGPAGEILFLGYTGTLYEVAGEGIRPVEGPGGGSLGAVGPPVWDLQGDLWVATRDRLWFRPPGQEWQEFPRSRLEDPSSCFLKATEDGGVVAVTERGIWRIDMGLNAVRLVEAEGIQSALVRADGTVVMLLTGRVVELRDGKVRELFRTEARPIDLVERGRTLWIGFDTYLVAFTLGEPPEILGPEQNVPSGGPLLVDREGSLWVGTFRGLLQFPEPETVAWGSTSSLGTNGTRRLALGPEGIWVDSWSGLGLLRRQDRSWRAERIANTGTSALCAGSDGTMWAGYRGHFLEARERRFISHARADLEFILDCSTGPQDRVWMLGNLGLVLADGASGQRGPSSVDGPPGARGSEVDGRVLEDSRGRLWVSSGEEICRADAAEVSSRHAAEWACSKADGAGRITSLTELSSGGLWAGTLEGGVYRLSSKAGWEPIPGSRGLPTRVVRKVRPSPSGGAWIISYGTILRAVERLGTAEGWEIVERPSPWHGLMISDAEDILEEASGDLWITTLAGVVHIPPEVRRAAPPVPPVELVDVLVDGEPLAWQREVELPYRRNRIELRFAGLSFRDPGLLQYQVRLSRDASWRDASTRPYFQFVDLPPGRYRAEVRASLDGVRWSAATANLSFSVLPPFYRTAWFLTLAALVLMAGAYAFYRYRLTQLLRLERVRTRIAADLHDDIGASLSRIAVQSELVRTPRVLQTHEAERLLSDIGESARSLVDSMSDIVWSVDPRRDDLASVIARIRQFALDLMEPRGIRLEFTTPPEAEKVRLAPEQRRHLYLLLKEAVNNIVKHAGCRHAWISLAQERGHLHAEVRDDGCGFENPEGRTPESPGGHGLLNMRSRARQIGATLEVHTAPGQGTVLRLTLPVRHADA
jgi:signal transduction histidine kinase/ligand-binding sensor domain-containing protein